MNSKTVIPYSRQSIDRDDIQAVSDVMQSPWLTTGPAVVEFEAAIAEYVNMDFAVSFSSGTAALHGMMHAAGIQPGDEVIVPAITFVATSNAVLFQGATPIFADVDPDTLLIDIQDVERKVTSNTRAIIAVDYAGQPCDYAQLRRLCQKHDLLLLSDSSHSLGAMYQGRPVPCWADMASYSFHPVKSITSAEGGMVVTQHSNFSQRMKAFRGHGIDMSFRERSDAGQWQYKMESLGYNYRLSDIHAALGNSQLKKLDRWTEARTEIAHTYQCKIIQRGLALQALSCLPDRTHSFHLFVVKLLSANRDLMFRYLRNLGIGVNVHYEPVYRHPYYQDNVPSARHSNCPQAERSIEVVLSLPIFPGMTDRELNYVLDNIARYQEQMETCAVSLNTKEIGFGIGSLAKARA